MSAGDLLRLLRATGSAGVDLAFALALVPGHAEIRTDPDPPRRRR
jgi:hypothetical protein